MVLKSDNEPAVVKVLQEALGALKVTGVQAGEEHSPPYDPQANGAVESAVKQVKGRLRTMKLCLERRIRERIPPRHPIIAWMVTHVADLLRFRLRGLMGRHRMSVFDFDHSTRDWFALEKLVCIRRDLRNQFEKNTIGIAASSLVFASLQVSMCFTTANRKLSRWPGQLSSFLTPISGMSIVLSR